MHGTQHTAARRVVTGDDDSSPLIGQGAVNRRMALGWAPVDPSTEGFNVMTPIWLSRQRREMLRCALLSIALPNQRGVPARGNTAAAQVAYRHYLNLRRSSRGDNGRAETKGRGRERFESGQRHWWAGT